jgi:hypothetical protein
MPLHAQPPRNGKPAQSRKRKQWITEIPPPAKRMRMFFTKQGTKPWIDDRDGNAGATSLAIVIGVSKFNTNDALWQEDMGLIAQGEQSAHDLFPLAHGTFYEPETCWIASFLLGVYIAECGMVPDPRRAHSRVSPDRLVVVPPWIAWNHWMMRNPNILSRILMEAKSPIHKMYTSEVITPKWAYDHFIPRMYRPQCVDQMAKFNVPANLFVVYGHANAWNPMRRVAGTNVFLVSEMLITLVFRNDAYADILYKYLDEHVQSQTDGASCPPRLEKNAVKVPPLRMMPILHARFFICGNAGTTPAARGTQMKNRA